MGRIADGSRDRAGALSALCTHCAGILILGLAFALWQPAHAGTQDAGADSRWLEPRRSELLADPQRLPFYPHRANTTENRPLAGNDFDRAEVCGSCHQEIFKQWQASAMAQAWEDPIYRALLARASDATGGSVDNFCTGCHTPVGLTTGLISSAVNRASPEETAKTNPMPGVDCEACHNISARTGLDNGAYLLHPLAHDGRPTKFGPRSDAVSPYHETQYSTLHTRSDFCAVCHNVTHPFNGVPIERTYDEWEESEYAQNGVECQHCHMPPSPGRAAIMGPQRDDIASHGFPGGNTSLATRFGHHDAAEQSRNLLRSAATLRILPTPGELQAGSLASIGVEVHNSGTGHKLPTGFPEGREVWIDFEVRDADGATLYRLGAVRDGRTEPGTRNYRVHMGDADGNEVDYAVWNVTHVISDNRILPNGVAHENFDFVLPEKLHLPLTVTATLNYWPMPQALVDELLGPGELPIEIVPIAEAQLRIDTVAPQNDPGFWQRVRNYLIAANDTDGPATD